MIEGTKHLVGNNLKQVVMDAGKYVLVEVHKHCKDGADVVITRELSAAKEPEIVDANAVQHEIKDTSKVQHQLEAVAQPTRFRTTVLELASQGLVSPNLLQALLKVGGRSILSIVAFRGSRMDGWESTEIK